MTQALSPRRVFVRSSVGAAKKVLSFAHVNGERRLLAPIFEIPFWHLKEVLVHVAQR